MIFVTSAFFCLFIFKICLKIIAFVSATICDIQIRHKFDFFLGYANEFDVYKPNITKHTTSAVLDSTEIPHINQFL